MMTVQKIFRFSGNVQGVGFRFTACRVAGGFDVVGYVKNLPDGSVECLVEGERDQISGFLDKLSQTMRHHIRQTTEQTAPVSGRWRDFGVEF